MFIPANDVPWFWSHALNQSFNAANLYQMHANTLLIITRIIDNTRSAIICTAIIVNGLINEVIIEIALLYHVVVNRAHTSCVLSAKLQLSGHDSIYPLVLWPFSVCYMCSKLEMAYSILYTRNTWLSGVKPVWYSWNGEIYIHYSTSVEKLLAVFARTLADNTRHSKMDYPRL